jgi:hypothetical protein
MSKDEHHNDIADQIGQADQDQRDLLMRTGDFLRGKDLKLLRSGDLLELRHDLKWYPNFFMVFRRHVDESDPDKEILWLFEGLTEKGELEILSIWEDLLDAHPEQFGLTLLGEGPEDRGDQNADGIFLKLQEDGEDRDLYNAVKQIRELRGELNKLEGFQRDDPIDATPINVSPLRRHSRTRPHPPKPPKPPEPPALPLPAPRPVPPLPPRISFNGATESTKTYVERVIAKRDLHREWEIAKNWED